MKHLTALIMDFEGTIEGLLKELQTLKMRAFALEEENEKLRREITELYRDFLPQQNPVVKKPVPKTSEGKVNLQRLYNEGFHVCHPHFGQSREGADCLFCVGFLSDSVAKASSREEAVGEN